MTIQQKISQELRTIKTIDRLINDSSFIKLYNQCEDKTDIDKKIIDKDIDAIKKWITERKINGNLWLCTTKELKQMARRLGVRNYERIHKGQLVSQINQKLSNKEIITYESRFNYRHQ